MNTMDQIIASTLNVSASDIETFQSTSVDGSPSFYFTIKSSISCCPICGSVQFLSKGYFKKSIKLPYISFQNATLIQKVKRFYCLGCHHSFSDHHYMSPNRHSVSYATIIQIMELLKDPRTTFKRAAELTNLSETTVVRVFDKHCHLSRYRFPEAVCIDEVYTKNSSFDSKYSCIFYDFFNHTIIDVTPSRKKDFIYSYLQTIPMDELNQVKYLCMDMYLPYKQVAKVYFKKALICVDSFHVIKHLNDDLSKLRIRLLKSFSSDSIEYYLLKHWKNLLFNRSVNFDNKGKFNKRLKRIINYRQLQEMILDIDPQLRSAFILKERYTHFNSTSTIAEAPNSLDILIHDFIVADIPEYSEFITLLQNWRQEIINSFTIYKGKRVNNGVAESINAIVSTLLFNTKGIRNSDRWKKRIMYAVNKTGFILK